MTTDDIYEKVGLMVAADSNVKKIDMPVPKREETTEEDGPPPFAVVFTMFVLLIVFVFSMDGIKQKRQQEEATEAHQRDDAIKSYDSARSERKAIYHDRLSTSFCSDPAKKDYCVFGSQIESILTITEDADRYDSGRVQQLLAISEIAKMFLERSYQLEKNIGLIMTKLNMTN